MGKTKISKRISEKGSHCAVNHTDHEVRAAKAVCQERPFQGAI